NTIKRTSGISCTATQYSGPLNWVVNPTNLATLYDVPFQGLGNGTGANDYSIGIMGDAANSRYFLLGNTYSDNNGTGGSIDVTPNVFWVNYLDNGYDPLAAGTYRPRAEFDLFTGSIWGLQAMPISSGRMMIAGMQTNAYGPCNPSPFPSLSDVSPFLMDITPTYSPSPTGAGMTLNANWVTLPTQSGTGSASNDYTQLDLSLAVNAWNATFAA